MQTVQFGMGTIGNNQFPAQLSTSHSDNEIDRYRRNTQSERDDPDCAIGDATWMQRSASLGQLNAAQLEFSEDDEQLDLMPIGALMRQERQMLIEAELAAVESREKGAARSRELPARKLRTRKASTTSTKMTTTRDTKQSNMNAAKATGAGIRGRRKLRDATPDMDIEIE